MLQSAYLIFIQKYSYIIYSQAFMSLCFLKKNNTMSGLPVNLKCLRNENTSERISKTIFFSQLNYGEL